MSTNQLPVELDTDENRSVLGYLAERSAHSDIAEALTDAVAPLGDVTIYCPSQEEYRYSSAHTKWTIFGFACGMSQLAFRLSPRAARTALATGGMTIESIGDEWIGFTLFRNDWPEVDTRFWARMAYVFARESGDT